MSKHTPGPWSLKRSSDDPHQMDVSGFAWIGLANVWVRLEGEEYDHDEGVANARLIAAAPDMLAALRKSADGWANAIELGLIPPQHRTAAEVMRDEAFAAIAKAEGRS